MKQRIRILMIVVVPLLFTGCEKYSTVEIADENFLQALTDRVTNKRAPHKRRLFFYFFPFNKYPYDTLRMNQ